MISIGRNDDMACFHAFSYLFRIYMLIFCHLAHFFCNNALFGRFELCHNISFSV